MWPKQIPSFIFKSDSSFRGGRQFTLVIRIESILKLWKKILLIHAYAWCNMIQEARSECVKKQGSRFSFCWEMRDETTTLFLRFLFLTINFRLKLVEAKKNNVSFQVKKRTRFDIASSATHFFCLWKGEKVWENSFKQLTFNFDIFN